MYCARLILVLAVLCISGPLRATPPAEYVGGAACAECHTAQAQQWAGSHHARAMQAATPATVLGDFNDATLTHFGVTTRFFRKGDIFMVRTDGPDGAMAEYEIAYTLGVYPLQQYLIALPGGRWQALGIAWDAGSKEAGGQRWFHLYPDRKLTGGDRLHWTGRDQTANFMCLDCHTTNLDKKFDTQANSYATSWTDPGVSCEACHGPGSRHVAWARAPRGQAGSPAADDTRKGIVNWLRATDEGQWEMVAETGIARRSVPRESSVVLDSCAGCHALRATLVPSAVPGTPALQHLAPTLLDPGAFHADGQIDGETFEYGAFLQSRMHRAGVTCTDCHTPHAGGLRAEGNAVCAACHLPAKFDTAAHHHHAPDSPGAQCVNCHMPRKTYMGVDVRHDHGFRVPRPDLSESLGTPNACSACHADKAASWAAQAVASWFPAGRRARAHYGQALAAGRGFWPDAERLLDGLIADPTQPGIARATALTMLPRLATGASLPAWRMALADTDPLVRMGAARGLPARPSMAMVQASAPLLADPVRAVRIEAARALAGMQPALPAEWQAAFEAAWRELIVAETAAADRPESQINLGLLYLTRGQPEAAEAAYRAALRLDPRFVPAMANLADLNQALGRSPQAMEWLRKAVTVEPENADIHHALGLALVRDKRVDAAMVELRRAAELAPDNPRYAYVLAIALNSTGAPREALALLERTRARFPGHRDVLQALVSISRDNGDRAAALRYAQQLVAAYPADPAAISLLRSLRGD